MKKLLIIPLFFMILSCAYDDSDNLYNHAYTNIQGDTSAPLIKENFLTIGNNQVNYNKSKTFHTLIYQAQSTVTNNYTITNGYSISANGQQVQDIRPVHPVFPKQADIEKDIKEKINDINKNFQQFAYKNNIKSIDKNTNIIKRTIPQSVTIGTKWENINLLNVDNDTFSTISATCIAVSENAYFFLQDGLTTLTNEQITEITTAFDKDYNLIHQYYGEETDTDGNGKVSFLIADLPDGLLGFFYTADKYSQQYLQQNIKSNEADVLYVNYNYFANDKWTLYQTDLKATFIHEFQHMVLFDSRTRLNLNPDVGTWLNEGLSMLSEYYAGYSAPLYNYLYNYFSINQGISLITNDSSQDYGLSYLFVRYLQIRFGDDFIKKIYSSAYTGIMAVEEAVGMDFNELFLDFVKMILVTGRNVTTDTRYNIEEFNYIEGTEGYTRNGFNLASLIDEVYSYNSEDSHFITSTGYNNKQLGMYGFAITRWSGNIDYITLSGSNSIAGMYSAW